MAGRLKRLTTTQKARCDMLGVLGTVGVVIQMALLSTGFSTKLALLVGLVSCGAWVGHSIKQKDRNLLLTNIIVAGFAVWGLAN